MFIVVLSLRCLFFLVFRYCNDAYETYGIDQNSCELMHSEYMQMVNSGKTIEVIAQELKADEDFENQGTWS